MYQQPQQGDMTSSYHQPQFQPASNPAPTANPTPIPSSAAAAACASAPPADYSNYSFNQSSVPPHNYDHAPPHIPNPTPPIPNSSSSSSSPSSTSPYLPPNTFYTFPHLDPNSPAYYPCDHNQSAPLNYDYSNPTPNYNSSISSASYSSAPYTAPPAVPNYDSNLNYGDHGMYGGTDGVYKYNGGKTAAYGGREARSSSDSSGPVLFDDYGRPINVKSNGSGSGSGCGSAPKIVKAVPKVEDQTDVKSSALKFRVKLLSEGYGQSDMDVLCQVGLDGIGILDPTTNRMLKIYPLDTVTRWEVLDSYIFAFWAKTSVDAELRRIRLKSNSYTTNNILDTVTAASIQAKEIGDSTPSDSSKGSEQPAEKKKGLSDWMNLIKPANEEKEHWVPDEAVTKCTACGAAFNAFNRRHHCRNCGDIFCDKCTQGRIALTAEENAQLVRVCDQCMAEVTQRLSNAKDTAARVSGFNSHEDLARKLQEEMNKNSKTSAGSLSGGSGPRMREVECPTCTVHLQVQVPASGSETIECSVCQHPFLVSAH